MQKVGQLGFDEIFAAEERERATAHLPADYEYAVPFYRGLIEQFHAALIKPDYETALAVQKEADELAYKLNGGNPGIKAGPDAPCDRLEKATATSEGIVPLWGQTGQFIITVKGAQVRIEVDGIYGIGARCCMESLTTAAASIAGV